MIVREMIAGALRLLGVYGAGETPADEDLNDGLLALNEMLNAWNAEHLSVYMIYNALLPLTAGTRWNTIGPGGTFDTFRPVKIETAGIVQANGVRSDLKIDTSAEFAAIPEKTVQGKLPLRLYCNDDYPLALITTWPIPSENCSLDLSWWRPLPDELGLDDPLDVPPAYSRALRYNLAVMLSSEYGKGQPLDSTIAGIAQQAKQQIMALNASNFAGTQDPPAAA